MEESVIRMIPLTIIPLTSPAFLSVESAKFVAQFFFFAPFCACSRRINISAFP